MCYCVMYCGVLLRGICDFSCDCYFFI
uniref:Uncharacterized protein n=1 Tax=Arundo donax TaxID=35708 RepID=A0A0A9BET5_ARUDO